MKRDKIGVRRLGSRNSRQSCKSRESGIGTSGCLYIYQMERSTYTVKQRYTSEPELSYSRYYFQATSSLFAEV